MYSITDLKKDTIIQVEGTPYKVVEHCCYCGDIGHSI